MWLSSLSESGVPANRLSNGLDAAARGGARVPLSATVATCLVLSGCVVHLRRTGR